MPDNVHVQDSFLEITMQPPSAPVLVPRPIEDSFHPRHAIGIEATMSSDRLAAFDEAREAALSFRNLPSEPGDDVTVTTLGTGSAAPSEFRNGMCLPCPSQYTFF